MKNRMKYVVVLTIISTMIFGVLGNASAASTTQKQHTPAI